MLKSLAYQNIGDFKLIFDTVPWVFWRFWCYSHLVYLQLVQLIDILFIHHFSVHIRESNHLNKNLVLIVEFCSY